MYDSSEMAVSEILPAGARSARRTVGAEGDSEDESSSEEEEAGREDMAGGLVASAEAMLVAVFVARSRTKSIRDGRWVMS
jgi:hypothetical protein